MTYISASISLHMS